VVALVVVVVALVVSLVVVVVASLAVVLVMVVVAFVVALVVVVVALVVALVVVVVALVVSLVVVVVASLAVVLVLLFVPSDVPLQAVRLTQTAAASTMDKNLTCLFMLFSFQKNDCFAKECKLSEYINLRRCSRLKRARSLCLPM